MGSHPQLKTKTQNCYPFYLLQGDEKECWLTPFDWQLDMIRQHNQNFRKRLLGEEENENVPVKRGGYTFEVVNLEWGNGEWSSASFFHNITTGRYRMIRAVMADLPCHSGASINYPFKGMFEEDGYSCPREITKFSDWKEKRSR
jgi:hypothetical protein